MALLDFASKNYPALREHLLDFIEEAGRDTWGGRYRGISNVVQDRVDLLLEDIRQRRTKVTTPAVLDKYFYQMYIMSSFLRHEDAIRWYPVPPPSKKYFVDFTRFWDMQEIKYELRDFINHIGRKQFKNFKLPDTVAQSIDQMLDKNLYGRKCGGYLIRSPVDIPQFFGQRYIQTGFLELKNDIKWMDDDPEGNVEENKLYSCADNASYILVDFTLTNTRVLKLQVDRFLMVVGRESVGEDYAVSKTLQKQVDRLLNLRFYGKTREHNITKPEDLDIFFHQKFVQRAFRENEGKIQWAPFISNPPKQIHRGYFIVRLTRPPLRRVPAYKNPAITRESWQKDPKDRKDMYQEELYWQIINIPGSIKSPLQLMPLVFAQKSTSASGTTWWCTKLSNKVNQITSTTTTLSQLPSWLNNAWPHITYKGRQMGHSTFLNHHTHSQFEEKHFTSAPYTVYCLVVYVVDYERWHMWQCDCKCRTICTRGGPCPIQVYVGKARHGLLDRWVEQRYAHTRVAKRLTNFMYELRENGGHFKMYEPGKESNAQLPQCMLGMAMASYYPSAVFVLKSCSNGNHMDDFESKVISSLKATDMRKGLNVQM